MVGLEVVNAELVGPVRMDVAGEDNGVVDFVVPVEFVKLVVEGFLVVFPCFQLLKYPQWYNSFQLSD